MTIVVVIIASMHAAYCCDLACSSDLAAEMNCVNGRDRVTYMIAMHMILRCNTYAMHRYAGMQATRHIGMHRHPCT